MSLESSPMEKISQLYDIEGIATTVLGT
jgi:hypothetical protein